MQRCRTKPLASSVYVRVPEARCPHKWSILVMSLFPSQFRAICPTPMESINGDLRKGIACPSLDFRKLTIWKTRLDMLPGTLEGANRVLHPF